MQFTNSLRIALLSSIFAVSATACDKSKSTTSPNDAGDDASASADDGTKKIELDMALDSTDGGELTIGSNSENDLILLSFWATWCKPCIAELKEVNEKLVPKFKDRGLHVYGISTDGSESLAKVSGHVAREKYKFPILLDQETAVLSRFNDSGDIPFYVLLNSSGEVVYKHQGYVDGDVDKLGKMLDEKLPK